MAYIKDKDLEFLGKLKSEDLKLLFEVLVYDSKNKKRFSESLLGSQEYERYQEDYAKYWQKIAEELQRFGGNSFANYLRKGGIEYRTIITKVCDKMKIACYQNAPIEEIERAMLGGVISQGCEKMSDSEIKEMCYKISKKHVFDVDNLDKQALIANMINIFRNPKSKDMDFILKLTSFITADVIKVVGAGVGAEFLSALAPNALRGPAGWLIGVGVVAKLVSDPAFRVTIPACFVVATLRLKASAKKSLFSLPFFK
ncbi:DUF3944 domain-containing protein [Helicobacter cetorum]|uniref:DUF3944 domain-containing protein n=1 Tax=Helicobacter cetorum TaxID=138563 RepID=UPI000CF0F1B5|nr:DUF3944 domain-containing protein [Helicobacter cetorum]